MLKSMVYRNAFLFHNFRHTNSRVSFLLVWQKEIFSFYNDCKISWLNENLYLQKFKIKLRKWIQINTNLYTSSHQDYNAIVLGPISLVSFRFSLIHEFHCTSQKCLKYNKYLLRFNINLKNGFCLSSLSFRYEAIYIKIF